MQAIEISSFGSRVAGRIVNKTALGTTLATTISTISRFFLIIFLPILAYIVESGITINNYLIMVIMAFSTAFIMSIVLIIKLNSVQTFYQNVFYEYNSNNIPYSLIKSLLGKNKSFKEIVCDNFSLEKIIFKKTLVSFITYLFLTSGFFIAFMLAVLFPENRLTLSQLTAFFHGFGAVIFAFYLDPMLSRSIDSILDKETWIKNIYSILLGRVLSYIGMVIFLLFFLLFRIVFP